MDGSPSDDDIKKLLKDILAEANLEEITMKTVCKKVYAHYPNHDLSQRKDFIKQTVKSVSLSLNFILFLDLTCFSITAHRRIILNLFFLSIIIP